MEGFVTLDMDDPDFEDNFLKAIGAKSNRFSLMTEEDEHEGGCSSRFSTIDGGPFNDEACDCRQRQVAVLREEIEKALEAVAKAMHDAEYPKSQWTRLTEGARAQWLDNAFAGLDAFTTTPEYQALAKDAERYRYWRDEVWFKQDECDMITDVPDSMMHASTPEEFDAAIDAARNG